MPDELPVFTDAAIINHLGQLPGVIVLNDLKGRLVWASRYFFGFDESVLGQQADSPIVLSDRQIWNDAVRRAIYQREISTVTVRVNVPTPPGWATVTNRVGPVVIADRVEYIICLAIDTTFRHNTNPAAKHMLADIERDIVGTLLLSREPLKASAIAKRTGLRETSAFRTTLANLVSRNILRRNGGYQITDSFLPIAIDLLAAPPS